jgi:hypothetical protein
MHAQRGHMAGLVGVVRPKTSGITAQRHSVGMGWVPVLTCTSVGAINCCRNPMAVCLLPALWACTVPMLYRLRSTSGVTGESPTGPW